MILEPQDIEGKCIVEIGCGRGQTTLELASAVRQTRDATLIATDVSNAHFTELQQQLSDLGDRVRFLQTSATELASMEVASVDLIVCNYALCAIASDPGAATIALHRFYEVLKAGARLMIEEEFPVREPYASRHPVWALKWRILKSATALAGGMPFNEIQPAILGRLCTIIGFEPVTTTDEVTFFGESDTLTFFEQRLRRLLDQLPNGRDSGCFMALTKELGTMFEEAGGMAVPYYRLDAWKL